MLPLRASHWNALALEMRARACSFAATSSANGTSVVVIAEQADGGKICGVIGTMIGTWSSPLASVLLRRPREYAIAVQWLTWGPCAISAPTTAEAPADRPNRGACEHRALPSAPIARLGEACRQITRVSCGASPTDPRWHYEVYAALRWNLRTATFKHSVHSTRGRGDGSRGASVNHAKGADVWNQYIYIKQSLHD